MAKLYLDVLEHIKKDEKEIGKAFATLKKGGYLIINVPAFSHLYSQFDKDVGHHKRYEKKDFKNLVSKLKVKNTKYMYYDSIGYLLSLMSKMLTCMFAILFVVPSGFTRLCRSYSIFKA